MGVRLDGRPIVGVGSTSRPSFPVTWGAVQVPSSGLPIVLSCEHQTMGGYPVPAVVIRADLDRLGQLRPGDRIRFETVSEASARAAVTARDETLRWARRILLERDEWDDLAGLAGS
jgi:allophanate hydrolase subunit 2